jgi:polyhydroxyalkanoate synthesis regulator protein
MQTFTKNQSRMQEYFRQTFGSTFGGAFADTFEQMGKQNMAIFEQAMRMFSPFGNAGASTDEAGTPEEASSEKASAPREAPSHLRPVPPAQPQDEGSIKQMQQRLDELQKQIAQLSKTEG